MVSSEIACPKCSRPMEKGFPLDTVDASAKVGHWVEGAPEYLFRVFLKQRKKRKLPITAYRCTSCGYLESYAK
jgi:hypothetical protein